VQDASLDSLVALNVCGCSSISRSRPHTVKEGRMDKDSTISLLKVLKQNISFSKS